MSWRAEAPSCQSSGVSQPPGCSSLTPGSAERFFDHDEVMQRLFRRADAAGGFDADEFAGFRGTSRGRLDIT